MCSSDIAERLVAHTNAVCSLLETGLQWSNVTKQHNHICDVDLHSVTNDNLGDLTVALTPGYHQETGSELWVQKTVTYRATAF